MDFGFAGEVTSLHCFDVMNYIQYANRTRQDFPVVENSAGYCCLKMQQMVGMAPRQTQPFILLGSAILNSYTRNPWGLNGKK